MEIHVVRPGDTLYKLARQYGVSMGRLIRDNPMPDPARLSVGQAIVIQFPRQTYVVRDGDSLSSIARQAGLSLRELLRNNYGLSPRDAIVPGQELVLSYEQEKQGSLAVNGYAYPGISPSLLQRQLPYLTDLTPFTYGITPEGGLVPLDDEALILAARQLGVRPLMHLSTLTEDGGFSNELAHRVLTDPEFQDRLARALADTIREKEYRGLDIDFEYVYPADAEPYARFVARMRRDLEPLDIPVITALAPKTFARQKGTLYEGHNYALLGQAADQLLLMTYEWGYTYGPPMAVAPIRNVRRVVEYALTEIPARKIWLGVPTYGYDWVLPYRRGSKATSLSNQQALELATRYRAAIRYDENAQSPWFRYVDEQGREHEVWFEDARSIRAKLELAGEFGLWGVSFWNLMRPFGQNWVVLNALYHVMEVPGP